jgi:hypothetical protein
MKTIRITGVPEHFNFPWKKVVSSQPFLAEGIQLQWTDESRGSGQMNKALRADETDISIVLTESFLKDFEDGNPSKIIGFHVKSPLIWGIHVTSDSPAENLDQLTQKQFLISRMGSGSHLMAFVLAQREGWNSKNLEFKTVGNLDGALEAIEPRGTELFLWEKYTTKPMVDSGHFKIIGEIPSPWPCFVIVATNKAITEYGELIFKLRDLVYHVSSKMKDDSYTAKDIHLNYGLQVEDAKSWLSQTNWETVPSISQIEVETAIKKMIEFSILRDNLRLDQVFTLDHLQLV